MAYHDLLKTAIARLVLRHEITPSDISSQLGISQGSIIRWRKEYLEKYTTDSDDLDELLTETRERVAEAVGVEPSSVKILVDLTPD